MIIKEIKKIEEFDDVDEKPYFLRKSSIYHVQENEEEKEHFINLPNKTPKPLTKKDNKVSDAYMNENFSMTGEFKHWTESQMFEINDDQEEEEGNKGIDFFP